MIVVLASSISSLVASADYQCGKRSVVVYDFDVQVPRPEGAQEISLWLYCFEISAAVEGFLMNNDPSREVINYFNGHSVDGIATVAGLGRTILAPSGPLLENRDYLITGKITKVDDTTYQAAVELQTSVSREVVKALNATFSLNNESVTIAGQKLGNELKPLRFIIEKFEKAKRDSDPKVIIGRYCGNDPKIVSITPEKRNLTTGDSTSVSIKMTDCDGAPLAGREVIFNGGNYRGKPIEGTKGGVVRPAKCVTDENGNATVTFVAGQEKMCATITAWVPFFYPWGQDDGAIESEPLFVDTRTVVWAVEFLYSEENESHSSIKSSSVVNPTTDPVTVSVSSTDQSHTNYFAIGQLVIIDKQVGSTVDTTKIDLDVKEDSIVSYSVNGCYKFSYQNREMSTSSSGPALLDYDLSTTDGIGNVTDSLSRSIYGSGFRFYYSKKNGSFTVSCKPSFVRKRYFVDKSFDPSNGWKDEIREALDTVTSGYGTSSSTGGTIKIGNSEFEILCDSTVTKSLALGEESKDIRYIYVRIYRLSPEDNLPAINDIVNFKNKRNKISVSRLGEGISIRFSALKNKPLVEIINATGRVCTFARKTSVNQIVYYGMPAGLYFLRVKSNDNFSPEMLQSVVVP